MHFAGHVSQDFLTLSATNPLLPSQTPLLSACTHFPPDMKSPVPHVKQSPSPGPLQLPQAVEQTLHSAPSLNVLSGQRIPVLSTGLIGSHFDRSFKFCVYPGRQELQEPVESEHCEHPRAHTPQSPVVVRKNPTAQPEHFVPSLLSTQPVLQVQLPPVPQTPFTQLHFRGSVSPTWVERQRPLPEVPSSHLSQPEGHGWHFGPKKPGAHDSHDEPPNSAGQMHCPAAEQTPAPEQAGEQLVDWMSSNASDGVRETWETSGTDSHRTTRPSFVFDETATQTFSGSARDLTAIGSVTFPTGAVGRLVKASLPE